MEVDISIVAICLLESVSVCLIVCLVQCMVATMTIYDCLFASSL